jgi:hypothetical protein
MVGYRVLRASVAAKTCVLLFFVAACGSGDDTSVPSHPLDAMAPDRVDSAEVDQSVDQSATADVQEEAGFVSDASPCVHQQSGPSAASAAQSAGFAGTETAYYALYNGTCSTAGDCANACVAAGGTMSSCSSGSSCFASGVDAGSTCLPPTYWLKTAGALAGSDTTTSAAELVLVVSGYDDALVLTKFHLNVPDNATILGLVFDVRREADDGFAADDAVRILKNGAAIGVDHAQNVAWPLVLTSATYGGAADTWGVSWTAADVRSDGFGISIAPKYTGPSSGNDRAHIDSVKATAIYTTACD